MLIDYTALFNISSLLDSQSSKPAFATLRHFQSFHNIFTSFVTLSGMMRIHIKETITKLKSIGQCATLPFRDNENLHLHENG